MYDLRDDLLTLFLQSSHDDTLDSFYYTSASDGTDTHKVAVVKREDADIKNVNKAIIVLHHNPSVGEMTTVAGDVYHEFGYCDAHLFVPRRGGVAWQTFRDNIITAFHNTVWDGRLDVSNVVFTCTGVIDATRYMDEPVEHWIITVRGERHHSRS